MMSTIKSLYRVWFVLVIFCSTVICGCKEDEVNPVYQPLAEDVATLKKIFENKRYAHFVDPFNDTAQIRWIPSWMNGVIVTTNDTTKFVHILLTPQLESVVNRKVIPNVYFAGYTKRLMVRFTKKYTFYLGTYYSPQIDQTLKIPGNFSGTLIMKDLETSKNYIYRYVNGAIMP